MTPPKYARIQLPAPNASKQDLHMPASEVERARSYFQELVKYRFIRVEKHKRGMPGDAAAHHFSGTIYVNPIENKSDFYMCLHEVGHIYIQPAWMENPIRLDEPGGTFLAEAAVVDEYNAEMFALEHLQLFGLDTDLFEKHAKRYVFKHVRKVHQKGTKWADLDERLRDIAANWLGITEANWLAQEWRLVD